MPDSMSELRSVIRVIDFETSGGSPPDTCIVEVGRCDLIRIQVIGRDPIWNVGLPHSALVTPTRPISPEGRAVHHITDREFTSAVDPSRVPLIVTKEGLAPGENIVALAAHAVADGVLLPGAGIPWIFIYKVALRLFPEAPRHSLQVLRYWLDLDLRTKFSLPAHRAGPDAFVTAQILARMFALGLTMEDALTWSSQPPLLPRVTFGRYRGTAWADVDTGFLRWVLERQFHSDIRYAAEVELTRRGAAAAAPETVSMTEETR